MRKQRDAFILDEFAPALELTFFQVFSLTFDFFSRNREEPVFNLNKESLIPFGDMIHSTAKIIAYDYFLIEIFF